MSYRTAAVLAAAGLCTPTLVAQESQQLIFQVAHPGGTWSNLVTALSGDQIEFRVMINYTGTRTDLLGLGNARFQPTFSGFDNAGAGASRDEFLPWLNNGTSSNGIPNSVLTQAQGASTAPLVAYSRVFPYASVAMASGNMNVLTEFRHDVGHNRAPAGSWARIAGTFSSNWPLPSQTAPPIPTAEINNILRGIASSQLNQTNAGAAWAGGTSNLIVFRGAFRLALDNMDSRVVELSIAEGSLLRNGGTNSADDRRYIAWQVSPTDLGSYRAFSTQILGATVAVVPAPSGALIFAAASWAVTKRRRHAS